MAEPETSARKESAGSRWLLNLSLINKARLGLSLIMLAFLVACLAEVYLLNRPFLPVLGWSMLAIVVAAQLLRWWCITTLGTQWNTRVVVVPGAPRVTGGPYRFFSHPNYVAVIAEGFALPLVHTAWITAGVFTVLNAVLLNRRIAVENSALARLG